MNEKIARIGELLAAGWDIEDIRSEEQTIDVLLQRRGAQECVVLDQQDAWDVLKGEAFLDVPSSPRTTLAVGAAP